MTRDQPARMRGFPSPSPRPRPSPVFSGVRQSLRFFGFSKLQEGSLEAASYALDRFEYDFVPSPSLQPPAPSP
jgi:hypothetical protein